MFTGYCKKPELRTFDAEGWFDSGDLAYMDGEAYVRISGRLKDVLTRRRERFGGGNRKSFLAHCSKLGIHVVRLCTI
jgi:acyl-CoA synthetase (AMP-forming)/AMP-acid ligase II